MVQDVAVRMQQRPETAIGNVEGYLFQVARSVLTDHARRGSARCAGRHVPIEEYHHPVELRSPARVAEGREELALVMAAIRGLPGRARQAFVLHRFEEMSYQAIAREMGISVSAVEKHIMKAIRILGASLG
jgi:RNA polymerase sigma-70 factor (ECF subfamily)